MFLDKQRQYHQNVNIADSNIHSQSNPNQNLKILQSFKKNGTEILMEILVITNS